MYIPQVAASVYKVRDVLHFIFCFNLNFHYARAHLAELDRSLYSGVSTKFIPVDNNSQSNWPMFKHFARMNIFIHQITGSKQQTIKTANKLNYLNYRKLKNSTRKNCQYISL